MSDPYLLAYADQFKALMRDKCRQMLEVHKLTGWTSISHLFDDPYEDDKWRLVYERGDMYIANVTDNPNGEIVKINLEALGIQA